MMRPTLDQVASAHLLRLTLLVVGLSGCHPNSTLVAPDRTARFALNIVFAEQVSSSAAPASGAAARAINRVTVSVIHTATGQSLIREQPLILQGGFAEGEVTFPVGEGTQTFSIIVFAEDSQNLDFFSGITTEVISGGSVPNDTLEIILQPAVSSAGSGTVEVSSVFQQNPQFDGRQAVDLETGTSWFSGGSSTDGPTSTFTWTATGPVFIGTVGIVNNSFHFNPSFRAGFGFSQVTFQVFSGPNGTGTMVFEGVVSFPRAFPVVRVAPLIQGRSIRLLLDGHEDPDCGGFSELLVVALDL